MRWLWLTLLIGCAPTPSGFADGEAPAEDDDDATGRPWIECPKGDCSLDVNVVEADGLAAPCPDVDCVAEYLDFAIAASEYGEPVDPDVLVANVLALAAEGAVPSPPEVSQDGLQQAPI